MQVLPYETLNLSLKGIKILELGYKFLYFFTLVSLQAFVLQFEARLMPLLQELYKLSSSGLKIISKFEADTFE